MALFTISATLLSMTRNFINGMCNAHWERGTVRKKAAVHGYMNGLFPGRNPASRGGEHIYKSQPDLRYCYDYGYRRGAQERKDKLDSGEWVLVRGVAGPPTHSDAAMLDLIRAS